MFSVSWNESPVDLQLSDRRHSVAQVLEDLKPRFIPDFIVYYDDSYPVSGVGWDQLTVPAVFYSVDGHHHVSWHRYFARCFNAALVAQKRYIPMFQEQIANVHYFPLWAPADIEPAAVKSIDVCFRGNLDPKLHPERSAFFDQLSAHVSIDVRRGDYRKAYPQARIVVNQNVLQDLNFRVFEAMKAGAMLITPDSASGLHDLFEPGRDLVTYQDGNAEDAAEKIRFYQANDAERIEISRNGLQLVCEKHSEAARAVQLEQILEELPQKKRSTHLGAAIALITSALLVAKPNPELEAFFTEAACQAFCDAGQRGETFEDDTLCSLFTTQQLMESMGKVEEACAMLSFLQTKYDNQPVLSVVLIDAWLRIGHTEQAQAVAATVSSKPEEFLASAPHLAANIRNQIRAFGKKDA